MVLLRTELLLARRGCQRRWCANTAAASTAPAAAAGTDREWHVRGGQGGTKPHGSHRRDGTGTDVLTLEEAVAMRNSLRAVLRPEHPAVRHLEAAVEKAAVLQRDWTDEDFHDGEAGNEARVATLEARFRSLWGGGAEGSGTAGKLSEPVTLGMALDLVGVYLKNYKVAKAAAIMDEALPECRRKGGVWLIKALNHASTVRMKQQRHSEALVMLRELESLVTYSPEEAPELFDMLYRNIGMALQALNKPQAALPYFVKCARVKGVATWWDRWDVGYCMATVAFESSDVSLLLRASGTIASALPLHRVAEPGEHVMHAKICQALADCYLALATLGEKGGAASGSASPAAVAADGAVVGTDGAVSAVLSEAKDLFVTAAADSPASREVLSRAEYLVLAEEMYKKAHRMFTDNCGYTNDLSGWCAAAVGLCLVQESKHKEALEFFLHAVYVASQSDIPKLSQLHTNVEMITACHNHLQDAALVEPFFPHFDTILARLDSPLLQDPDGVLIKIKRALSVMLACSAEPKYRDQGLTLLQEYF